jgi:NAD(P)-dependent dehydrogenase (short-subunit alcohol dehydrogenase family)
MRGLEGKRVVITGGASGIGAATAAPFLEEGAAVVVLDRDVKGRKQIQTRLPKLAGTVDADVSNLKQVEVAFAEAVRLMGGVDVLIKIDDTGAGPGHDAAPAETIAPNQLMMPQNLVVCELKGVWPNRRRSQSVPSRVPG